MGPFSPTLAVRVGALGPLGRRQTPEAPPHPVRDALDDAGEFALVERPFRRCGAPLAVEVLRALAQADGNPGRLAVVFYGNSRLLGPYGA